MTLPLLVTIIAAVIGNVLGYTVFKNICAGMYYGSYSLPTYETRWNMDAFVLTTIVPFVIMLLVNLILISKRLKLTPLKFLRRDLSTSKKQKAVRLPDNRFFDGSVCVSSCRTNPVTSRCLWESYLPIFCCCSA